MQGNRNATFLAWQYQIPNTRADSVCIYKISFWYLMELKDVLWTKTSLNVDLICCVPLGFHFENTKPNNFLECYNRHFYRKKKLHSESASTSLLSLIWSINLCRIINYQRIEVERGTPSKKSEKILMDALAQWIVIVSQPNS